MTAIVELRCAWRFAGTRRPRLLLDAEVVELSAGADARVLCHGRPVWPPDDDFALAAMAWLGGRDDRWDGDPRYLPDKGRPGQWGDLLAACLERGVGAPELDDLLVRRAHHENTTVRVSFRAGDHRAARLPVETLVWPRHETDPLVHGPGAVSIVRVADSVETDASAQLILGPRDPGRYHPVVLEAPGNREAHGLGDLSDAIKRAGAEQRSQLFVDIANETDFQAFTPAIRRLVGRADLLVVCGHGHGGEGLDVRRDTGFMDGPELARGLPGSPGVTVLAMCGSAMRDAPGEGDDERPSPAEALAERGVAISIGFQGIEADLGHVRQFLKVLMRTIIPALGRRVECAVTLEDWEAAIAAARMVGPTALLAPVVWVHPALLAGRATGASAGPRIQRAVEGRAEVTPWYVPGQVICFEEANRARRVPLPVDVGIDMQVSIGESGCHETTGSALSVIDLRRCASGWGLSDACMITLRVDGRPPAGWALRAAELSALLRGMAAIMGQSIPATLMSWLNAEVRESWGAHDAAPRVVDIATGRSVDRSDRWPPLIVHDNRSLPRRVAWAATAVEDRPPLTSGVWTHVSTLHDPERLTGLIRAQRRVIRGSGAPPALCELARKSDTTIVLPAAAEVVVDASSDAVPGARLPLVRERHAGSHELSL